MEMLCDTFGCQKLLDFVVVLVDVRQAQAYYSK